MPFWRDGEPGTLDVLCGHSVLAAELHLSSGRTVGGRSGYRSRGFSDCEFSDEGGDDAGRVPVRGTGGRYHIARLVLGSACSVCWG